MTRTAATVTLLAVLVLAGCRRRPPEEQFAYDLGGLDQTPAAELLYGETGQIALSITGQSAMTIDASGRLYVAGENMLHVLDATGAVERAVAVNGTPRCLAVADNGTIYAGIGNHVDVFAPDGTRGATWPARDPRAYPAGIVVLDEHIFVADAGNRIVTRHGRDGSVTATITGKNTPTDTKGFIIPSPHFDLAVGRDKSIWVVNPGRHRIENYSLAGVLETSWGKASMRSDGFCGCCNPTHIVLFDNGAFLTAEKGLVRIKVYAPDGTFTGLVAGPESFPNERSVAGIAIDPDGRVLVLDSKLPAVRIFTRIEP